jgi:hypothetical protein
VPLAFPYFFPISHSPHFTHSIILLPFSFSLAVQSAATSQAHTGYAEKSVHPEESVKKKGGNFGTTN